METSSYLDETSNFNSYIYPANAIGILQRGCYERIHAFNDGTVIDVLIFPFGEWDPSLRIYARGLIATHMVTGQGFQQTKYWCLEMNGNFIELDSKQGYKKSTEIPTDLIRSIVTDTAMFGAHLISKHIEIDNIRSNRGLGYSHDFGWNIVLMETSRRLAETLSDSSSSHLINEGEI